MKITRIDTTYWKPGADVPWKPNWVWVRVHTDTGLVGLGETYPRNEAEASLVHSSVAGILLGRDPRDIERIWADLYSTALTNHAIQESCQVLYESIWPTVLENPLVPRGGTVRAPDLPGFGMQIKPEAWTHPVAITTTSKI